MDKKLIYIVPELKIVEILKEDIVLNDSYGFNQYGDTELDYNTIFGNK